MTTAHDRATTPRPRPGWVVALAGLVDPGEPHAVRGPFARWPRASDGVLAGLVFVLSVIAVGLSALDDGQDATPSALADRPTGVLALLAAGAGALWWRRSHPIPVTAAVLAGMMAWAMLGHGDGHDLALVVALYSVGRFGTNHGQSVLVVAIAAAISILGTLVDAGQRVDLAPAVLLTVLPWYVGRRIRNRGEYLTLLQDRANRLEAEQQARARKAVADERARIARELHDVVAHRVSMMTVQAGAARTIARHDLDAAIEAMGDTERAGRQALGELRHLLGVLRPADADPDELGPRPGLAEIPAVIDELRRTGAQVDLAFDEPTVEVPAAVALAAYRIVQESLTNIIKHAGPEPVVDIGIAVEDDQLAIEITNTTDSSTEPMPTSGYGVLGMGERAASLGGTLRAAPDRPGRYRVTARLPLEPRPA